jgi:hypothetical protein
MLNKGFLLEQEHSRMAHRIIRKLSEACDRLPSSLFITGVSGREEHPTFGGGYGDIYRALHSSKPVALKRMRHFLRGSDLRRIRLVSCTLFGAHYPTNTEFLPRSSRLERITPPAHPALPRN